MVHNTAVAKKNQKRPEQLLKFPHEKPEKKGITKEDHERMDRKFGRGRKKQKADMQRLMNNG